MEFFLIIFVAMFFFGGAGGVPTGGMTQEIVPKVPLVAPVEIPPLDT